MSSEALTLPLYFWLLLRDTQNLMFQQSLTNVKFDVAQVYGTGLNSYHSRNISTEQVAIILNTELIYFVVGEGPPL